MINNTTGFSDNFSCFLQNGPVRVKLQPFKCKKFIFSKYFMKMTNENYFARATTFVVLTIGRKLRYRNSTPDL